VDPDFLRDLGGGPLRASRLKALFQASPIPVEGQQRPLATKIPPEIAKPVKRRQIQNPTETSKTT
jgi:hypothetical protein